MAEVKIQVPDGYALKQVSAGKWELVKSEKDIRDILKDDASYIEIGLFFLNGLDSQQRMQRFNRVIALSKLQCVADLLNEGWEPNWDDTWYKWFITYDNTHCEKELKVDNSAYTSCGQVAFKSKELAQRAIEICGEKLIKEALMV